MKRSLFHLCVTVLLVALSAPPATSQVSSDDNLSAVRSEPPGILNGHEFVPTSFIEDPFVRTSLRTGLGFGITPNLVAPSVTIGDSSISGLKGSLMFAVLNVEYQHSIRDWLSFGGRLQVVGRMANETVALLSQGVSLVSAFEMGWLFRVHQSDRLLLSGSLGIMNADVTDVYLQRFIDGVIENGTIAPGSKLVQTTSTLRGGTGLRGAYAISELVGLTCVGELNYGESADRKSESRWYYSLTAAVDFNLLRPNGTPVGFVVGGRTRTSPLGQLAESQSIQTVFGRIAYTGSRDFSIGLDLGFEVTGVRGLDARQKYLSALVDTRLYF